MNKNLVQITRRDLRRYSNATHQNFADVIISGGGMVGTAMACALGK